MGNARKTLAVQPYHTRLLLKWDLSHTADFSETCRIDKELYPGLF